MDNFGVLTESYGLKPQGKAAPMAASKRSTGGGNFETGNSVLNFKSSSNSSWFPQNSSSIYGSFLDDHNGSRNDLFEGFQKASKEPNSGRSGLDYNFMFTNPNNSSSMASSSPSYDDYLFGEMPKQSVSFDDLLDKIGGLNPKSSSLNLNGSGGMVNGAAHFDELLPGFGGSSLSDNGASTKVNRLEKSTLCSVTTVSPADGDPFLIFERTSTSRFTSSGSESIPDPLEQFSKLNNTGGTKNASPLLRPPPKATKVSYFVKGKSPGLSSIDELENFVKGHGQNNAGKRSDFRMGEKVQTPATKVNGYKVAADHVKEGQPNGVIDLESFFSVGSRSSSAPKSRANNLDHASNDPVYNWGRPEVPQRSSSGSSAPINKSSVALSVDDLSSLYGAPLSEDFQEVEGESEERRRARLGRFQRTQERAVKALADMNQRDLQSKQEQEERRRISEIVDIEIKCWAAGKEGNMRALLSSLQYVLWLECGWQPVALTDMITSASVKKVYRKATLCIHPDKVQQKGATLQQRYTAEKVFDILKEAWNKFNKEELS